MITEIRDIRITEIGIIVDVMYFGGILPVSLTEEEAVHQLVAPLILGTEQERTWNWDTTPIPADMPIIDMATVKEIPFGEEPC